MPITSLHVRLWLNAVQGFFANLTKKRLKRGAFQSLQKLKNAVHRFADETNANQAVYLDEG
jgi:hypothetical protein